MGIDSKKARGCFNHLGIDLHRIDIDVGRGHPRRGDGTAATHAQHQQVPCRREQRPEREVIIVVPCPSGTLIADGVHATFVVQLEDQPFAVANDAHQVVGRLRHPQGAP